MDIFAKILVVDDEIMVTKTLKTLLKLEGYNNVFTFNSPNDALLWLKDNNCSVIISDFIMPDMNGIEFLIKAKEIYPDTTQILLTGYADKENAIRAINEVGIFKYIEKPWNNDDIILNIKNGIERTSLKVQLKNKIKELEELNKNLESIVEKRTQELKSTNNKLETIIKNLSEGLVVLNSNNLIEQANDASYKILKADENLIGKNFFELLMNEKNQTTSLEVGETLYLKDFSVVDYVQNLTIPIELSLSKISIDNTLKTLVLMRDVTAQKDNERLKDDFIATLTHDLRTPVLASINGLEFALNGTLGELNEQHKELFLTMKRSMEDMLGLVNVLLEVYRYESKKMHLVKNDFNIKDLITDSIKELEPLAKKTNLTFDVNLDDVVIKADRSELKRVIFNILGNAIKHSFENGKIIVKTEVDNQDIKVSIQDFGEGLSKEDIETLFKKFQRGNSKKRLPSTGLGLYLSRQIIEALNGTIEATGEVNKGATFSFTLKNAVKINEAIS